MIRSWKMKTSSHSKENNTDIFQVEDVTISP